jgi:RNA polymerase sigma factor (sigma-70 family)
MFQYGVKFKDDPEFVKDCIQDVFIQLIRSGHNLKSTTNIRYYLLKALKNAILKELNKSRKIIFVIDAPVKFEARFVIENELAEKENASLREKALLNALNNLSDRQREIIYLRYECNMDYDQISGLLNIKVDSTRKLVFRAIKALREAIEGEMNIPILFLLQVSPQKYVF